MRKTAVLFLLTIFAGFSLFAQEKIERIVIVPFEENLDAGDKIWLPGSVADKLQENMQQYTDFSFVSANDGRIKELQRKSESFAYSEGTAIEVGKLTSATHAIFLTVRRAGSLYTITAELANLTTGKSVASAVSEGRENIIDLSNGTGSSADEITIDLCARLGVPLTGTQKQMLLHGGLDVSDDEKIKMFYEEEEKYKKQILQVDREIELLSKSSDLSASAQMSKKLAERALAEQKLKTTQANIDRLEEINRQKQEEILANEERTEAQKKRINALSGEVNKKASELRKLKLNNETAFGRIGVIEAKKEAYINLEENVKTEKAAVEKELTELYEKKIDAVKNRKYRGAEMREDGSPTNDAIKRREKEIEELNREYEKELQIEYEKIENSVSSGKEQIKEEIESDLKTLRKTEFYANSLNDTLRISFNRYDGESKSWRAIYSVLCDGVELGRQTAFIKFDEIEKISPSGLDYADAVDLYDSLLRCDEPFLVYEASYTVEPDKYEASTYIFKVSKLKIFATKKVSVTKNDKLSGKSFSAGEPFEFISHLKNQYDYNKEEREAAVSERNEEQRKAVERQEKSALFKEKIRNKPTGIFAIGVNMPFFDTTYESTKTARQLQFKDEWGLYSELGIIFKEGLSLKIISQLSGASYSPDFLKNSDYSPIFISIHGGLGYSPVHNDYVVLSVSGIVGGGMSCFGSVEYSYEDYYEGTIEKSVNNSYFMVSVGGNVYLDFNLCKEISIFTSFTAIYNFVTEEISWNSGTEKLYSDYTDSFRGWNMIPTVGIRVKIF